MMAARLCVIASCCWCLTAALILDASDAADVAPEPNRTIADVIANDESLDDFYSLLEAAGLVDLLRDSNSGDLTVFAPTFVNKFDNKYLTKPWILHLRDILKLHFAQGNISSDQLLVNKTTLEMLNGEQVRVKVVDSSVILLSSSNTDEALVVKSDLFATNGVVHKINTALLPFWYNLDLVSLAVKLEEVWDDISASMGFLWLAVDKGGLQPFGDAVTVFYPTDSAWVEVDAETWDYYTDPKNTLEAVELAKGHVVETVYPTVSAKDGDVLTTMAGTRISVTVLPDSNNTILLNDELPLDHRRDILAKNGIVHGIGKFLIPPPLPPTTAPSPTFKPNSSGAINETMLFQDITLTFIGVFKRLTNDELSMFENVTATWYRDFFAAREVALNLRNFSTEVSVTHQKIITNEASLTLTYDQAIMYVSLGDPKLLNEEYVTAPFLDADTNNEYWWRLITTIETFFDLQSPIEVPQISNATATEAPNESDSERQLSIGAITGVAVGVLLILVFIAAFAAFRWGSKRRDMSAIPAVAVPAEDNVMPSNRSDVTMRPEMIVEVLPPPSGLQTDIVDDLLPPSDMRTEKVNTDFPPSGKPLPAYKDQVRHATAPIITQSDPAFTVAVPKYTDQSQPKLVVDVPTQSEREGENEASLPDFKDQARGR